MLLVCLLLVIGGGAVMAWPVLLASTPEKHFNIFLVGLTAFVFGVAGFCAYAGTAIMGWPI